MRRALAIAAAITAIAVCAAAQAPVTRPDIKRTRGRTVPDVTLLSEDSTAFRFSAMAGKPIIVSPIFTSCPHTCSLITASLRDALAEIGEPEVGYHVLTVSFDPADGPAQLRAYREKLQLPAGWRLAVASPDDLAQLLDAIDFRYEALDEGGFAHPNGISIIDPELKVAAYINGVSYDAAEVRRELESAVRGTSLVHKARPLLLAISLLGLLTVVAVLFITGRKARPQGA
ncbi:MAG TPA: SCO family protein [Candidatus Krumholzibacteria bacterium]|nr:SCO family protein [Candidatus Krumholzibacteria bacterium]